MSLAFSTVNSHQFSVGQPESTTPSSTGLADDLIPQHYQLEKCAKWIVDNNFCLVALQFPDELLCDAAPVSLWLEKMTRRRLFVLADTSFGSCCVDEISAQHVNADSIIHFGHSCLSVTSRLPVFFVFPDRSLDVPGVSSDVAAIVQDCVENLVVFCDVIYQHALDDLCASLSSVLKCRIVPAVPLLLSGDTSSLDNPASDGESGPRVVLSRVIRLTRDELDAASVVFVGACDSVTAACLAMSLGGYEVLQRVWICDPTTAGDGAARVAASSQQFRVRVTQLLRRRRHLVERARDARRVGILVGTLSVSRYLPAIARLREHLTAADKRHYTLLVGRLNEAKLANLAELDVFVLLACSESCVVEGRGRFLQPLVTPFEMLEACSRRPYHVWPADAAYVTEFATLLQEHYSPGHVTLHADVTDVSLISGRLRWLTADNPPSAEPGDPALVPRSELPTVLHAGGAAQALLERQWHGLEPKPGQTPVRAAESGQTGIAAGYRSVSQS